MAAWVDVASSPAGDEARADVNLAGLVGPSLKKGKENYEPYGVELYQRVCEREGEGLPRRGVGYNY